MAHEHYQHCQSRLERGFEMVDGEGFFEEPGAKSGLWLLRSHCWQSEMVSDGCSFGGATQVKRSGEQQWVRGTAFAWRETSSAVEGIERAI